MGLHVLVSTRIMDTHLFSNISIQCLSKERGSLLSLEVGSTVDSIHFRLETYQREVEKYLKEGRETMKLQKIKSISNNIEFNEGMEQQWRWEGKGEKVAACRVSSCKQMTVPKRLFLSF